MMDDMYMRKPRECTVMPLPLDATVTMAYVPYQQCDPEMYNPEQGISCGTMFPELDKPFMGCGRSKR